jgi:DNA mismatch repair protein MutS
LNQIGCFVPATSAKLSLVDRIFVRSGASDMISEGLSTFMVEMVETAQIIQKATSKSFVVMDEIGRGTSTYDGISIAWAVAEYLVSNTALKPKTLFATHYHELQELESKHKKHIKNYHMAVEEERGKPIFLYTLLPKGASHSYGIAVARLAGLPEELITNAYKVLHSLEKQENTALQNETGRAGSENVSSPVIAKLGKLDIDHMTPIEALTMLSKLKKDYS